jgi:hypothetical protein
MRLWSLHPRYLDRQGLLAVWREALLAQAVLRGRTRGYRSHPQLERFRSESRPEGVIAGYLRAIWMEADSRGYRFDAARINGRPGRRHLDVSVGQLEWEWAHLRRKLEVRSPDVHRAWRGIVIPEPHPLFRPVPGARAEWERGSGAPAE